MARHLIMALSLVFSLPLTVDAGVVLMYDGKRGTGGSYWKTIAAERQHMRVTSTKPPQELMVIIDSEQRNSSC